MSVPLLNVAETTNVYAERDQLAAMLDRLVFAARVTTSAIADPDKPFDLGAAARDLDAIADKGAGLLRDLAAARHATPTHGTR